MIRAILACDSKNGIGKEGSIPWKHKDDMRFFKMATIGYEHNIVVMGRKTKESIPNFPLQKRNNFVLSRSGKEDFTSLEELMDWIKIPRENDLGVDIYIIGGASIYHQCFEMRIPQEIYLTRFDEDYECDTFIDFHFINKNYKIQDSRRIRDYTFQVWERK